MRYKIITRLCDQPELEEFIKRSNTISYDVESTGLSHIKDKVIGFSISNAELAYYVSTDVWNGSELVPTEIKQNTVNILVLLKQKKLVGHNIGFDVKMTKGTFSVNLIDAIHSCTMLMYHTYNENLQNYGLKQLGQLEFGASAIDEKTELTEHLKNIGADKHEYYKANVEILGKYACKDAVLTYRMYELLESKMSEDLKDFFYDKEVVPLLKSVTIPMETFGIPVDVQLLKKSRSEIEADMLVVKTEILTAITPLLDNFDEWWFNKQYPPKRSGPFVQQWLAIRNVNWKRTATGNYQLSQAALAKVPDCLEKSVVLQAAKIPECDIFEVQLAMYENDGKPERFNILSKDHLKRLFFTKLGESATSHTDLGNPQVTEEFLDSMTAKYPWCKRLIVYNKLTKLKSAYMDQYLDAQIDGQFYPRFSQHRTVSGRYSSDLQQLPRPISEFNEKGERINDPLTVKYTNLIRHFFKVKPGYTFIDADYESAEPRVFAHVAGDDALKQIFENGEDFYSKICIMAEKLDQYSAVKTDENYLGKLNKDKRQQAKAYALGTAYGLRPYKLAHDLGISEQRATDIHNGYMAAFPELAKWMQTTKQTVLQTGQISTQLGRVRRYQNLVRLYSQHGPDIFDGLKLWQKYNQQPATYERVKTDARYVSNCVNNAYNHQIQALTASIINRAMIALSKKLVEQGLDAYICASIHDEVLVLSSDDCKIEVASLLQQAMEETVRISVHIPAVPSFGQTYAEAKG